jgi:hypothetical protein
VTMKAVKPESTLCPVRRGGVVCGGILWNITSRLAEALGVMTLRCAACERVAGVRVSPQPDLAGPVPRTR